MTHFRAISDQTYGEAAQIIGAALGTGERTEFEVMPGFDNAVASTAIALGEGAPNAFFQTHDSKPEDFLKQGSLEWRHFHTAVARSIDQHRSGEVRFESSGDAMRHIAGDVLHQASERSIAIAASNSHPEFSKGLDERQLTRLENVREGVYPLEKVRRSSIGLYEELPASWQSDIAGGIAQGDHLTQPVDDRIARLSKLIDEDLKHAPGREREASLRLGDFSDYGKAIFPEVRPEHVTYARALVAGEEKPWNNADRAIVAHASLMQSDLLERVPEHEFVGAYAREIAVSESSSHDTVTHSAARIESDLRLTRHYQDVESRMDAETWNADSTSLPAQIGMRTERSEMTKENQVDLFTQIHSLHRVSGLAAMRLAVAGEDVENGDLLIGRAKEFDDRKVTYVNISEKEGRQFGEEMFVPGDAVRLDTARRIIDFDHETAKAKLGTDPLIVTRAVVEGVDMPNGMGGTSRGARMSYELGGVEGRFPANAFQHERGEEHSYGVLALEAGKLWLVPMDPDANAATVSGAAREVTVSTASRHVGSLEEMREMVSARPAAGEFVAMPESFGRKDGPVELVGMPWSSDASPGEITAARQAIREVSQPSVAAAMGARQAMVSQGR